MNTIAKDQDQRIACPRGHAWCDGHDSNQEDGWHSRQESLTTSIETFPVFFVVEEKSGDPTIYFEIDEWSIAFGDIAEEIAHLHQFADAIAARLTWFTVGVEALAPFTSDVYMDEEGEGAPPEYRWTLPCAGTDFEHAIVFDTDLGWRMMPVTGVDALPSAVAGTWIAEVETLRVACEFLREVFTPRERP